MEKKMIFICKDCQYENQIGGTCFNCGSTLPEPEIIINSYFTIEYLDGDYYYSDDDIFRAFVTGRDTSYSTDDHRNWKY